MNFQTAVQHVFANYATFSGRARRSEYWYFALFYVILSVIASIVDQIIGTPILAIVLLLAFIVPTLAVGVRRLHDIGRSGWWLLIGLIPLVGFITLLVFYCSDSQPGANQHGPSPKELGGGYPPAYGGGYPPPPPAY